jgi:enoyl-CoA hydratase
MDDLLLVDRDGPIATVTLNRPNVLNALNAALIAELSATFAALERDGAVRVVVLTGAGERAFAAGADIAELAALDTAIDGERKARTGQALTEAIEASRLIVIAAVNGFALGGGCELALACDIRVAAENAKFGQPEVNLGVPPGYGGTQRLTRLIGAGMASYLCLTGETIDAAEAVRIGLVQRVVPAAELAGEARRIAGAIAAKAPLAIAAVKRAIIDGANVPLDEALALEAGLFGRMIATADFREGAGAFLGKRKPSFTGR